MILNYSRADGENYTLSISFSDPFWGEISANFKHGEITRTVKADISVSANEEFLLSCQNIEFLSDDYTVDVTCKSKDISKTKHIKYISGYPQLSSDTVKMAVAEMTAEEKCALFVARGAERHMAATTFVVERLGIPTIYMADGPAGLRVDVPTVGYPSGTTLANTWDRDAMQKVTAFMGDDCNGFGVDVLLAPGMNIQKNILNGRNFEYFSEDPYLTGMMAAHYTLGAQSEGVGVCLKHYSTNNQESSRMTVSSVVTERALREIYLKGYDYAVEKGAPYTVMTAYNRINGVCAPNAKDLITDVLKGEFGFDGFVMSDWGAHGGKDMMIASGNDMYCGSPDPAVDANIVKEALTSDKITEKQLDLCCENILSVVARSQAMNRTEISYTISNKEEKLQTVREVGADGMVLMKNDIDTLPMSTGKKIALFGNASYTTEHCGYGAGYVIVSHVVTVKEGLENADFRLDGDVASLYTDCKRHPHILNQEANPTDDQFEIVITEDIAQNAAKNNDCAIFTISRMTMEGADHTDIKGDLRLNDREAEAVKNISRAFRKAGKKFIVLINTGNPIEMSSWADMADAILYIGLSGEQIGNSTADILTGKVNPSGKLASTWPLAFADTPCSDHYPNSEWCFYYDDIYVGYRYYTTFDIPTMYEFGYGLSYTKFDYTDFNVNKTDEGYVLSVKVTNSGKLAGREAVQFYVSKPDGKNEHPMLELVGFAKTPLLASQDSIVVTATVTDKELMTYFTPDAQWMIEQGEYTFSVGASVKDIRMTQKIVIEKEIVVRRVKNVSPLPMELDTITKKNPKRCVDHGVNLALEKTVYASGAEEGFDAIYAVDGSHYTRWSAIGTQGEHYWFTVDLGETTDISKVVLRWESNSSGQFDVMISDDSIEWNKIKECKYEPVNTIELGITARYVKIIGKAEGFFSLYELAVY